MLKSRRVLLIVCYDGDSARVAHSILRAKPMLVDGLFRVGRHCAAATAGFRRLMPSANWSDTNHAEHGSEASDGSDGLVSRLSAVLTAWQPKCTSQGLLRRLEKKWRTRRPINCFARATCLVGLTPTFRETRTVFSSRAYVGIVYI